MSDASAIIATDIAEEIGHFGLDLLSPLFIRDPYPRYAYLRANDPVHRTKQGAWLLTRHADIEAAFSDPHLGNAPSGFAVTHARNRDKYVCADVAHHILPFLDKPEHIAPRRMLGSAFRRALRERPVDFLTIAKDTLRDRSLPFTLEIIRDFGQPFSLNVIATLMGLSADGILHLARWSESFFYLFAAMPSQAIREKVDADLTEFRGFLRDVVADRRRRPGNDVISALLAARSDGIPMPEAQVIDNCMLLIADGLENVDAGIANLLLALHRYPDAMDQLRRDPTLVGAAVDEILRYDPPAQFIGRIARADTQIGGRNIRKDSVVLLALAAANRDPDAFPQPDTFSFAAQGRHHLGFGRGRHACIGAPLVRLEMAAALYALIVAAPRIAVDDAALAWEPRPGHRWLTQLRVSFLPV